jgi:hypothetical protein
MAVTQYIGARYVPVFADPVDWNNTRTYEPLTIVLYQGDSYTSAQYVPKGIDITNEDFWKRTGSYNAQVEQYRKDVVNLTTKINDVVVPNIDKNTAAIDKNATAIDSESKRAIQVENNISKSLSDISVYVTPEMYVSDTSAADYTEAFTKAFASGLPVVCTANKTYNVRHVNMGLEDSVSLYGNGCVFNFIDTDLSKWNVSTQYNANCMFYAGEFDVGINEEQNIYIDNCTFKFNAAAFTNIPTKMLVNGFGLGFYGCNSVSIYNCRFYDSFESAIYYLNIGCLRVDSCTFDYISMASTVLPGVSRNCFESAQNNHNITATPTDVYLTNIKATRVHDSFYINQCCKICYIDNVYYEGANEDSPIVENHVDAYYNDEPSFIYVKNCYNLRGQIANARGSKNYVYIDNCYVANSGSTVINSTKGATLYINNTTFGGSTGHNAFYVEGSTAYLDTVTLLYDRGKDGAQLIGTGSIHIINSNIPNQNFTSYYSCDFVKIANSTFGEVLAKRIMVVESSISRAYVLHSASDPEGSTYYLKIYNSTVSGSVSCSEKTANVSLYNVKIGEVISLSTAPTGIYNIHDCIAAKYDGTDTNIDSLTYCNIHDCFGPGFMRFTGTTVTATRHYHDNSYSLRSAS